MDYTNHLNAIKNKKREIRAYVKELMLQHMVSDNLSDIIPKGWKIESSYYSNTIRIIPEDDTKITTDIFDKVTAKFAKIFNKQPRLWISEDSLESTFRIKPNMGDNDRYDSVSIEIRSDNSEKCDVVYETVTEKRAVLTGYCAALQDKKYELIHK